MKIDNKDFDVMLDVSDENFIEDLMKALGIEPGGTLNISTPQFTRTDGHSITYTPTTQDEYAALRNLEPENLKKIGCQIWDKEYGKTIWLYPGEWYNHIPAGTEIVDIFGDTERFIPGETDDDIRFGALSFGFVSVTH